MDAKTQIAVRLLNEILNDDRAAISCLFLNRVPIHLNDHSLCNVWKLNQSSRTIGTLGVINGLLKALDIQQIAAVIDDEHPDTIHHFEIFNGRLPLAKRATRQAIKRHE